MIVIDSMHSSVRVEGTRPCLPLLYDSSRPSLSAQQSRRSVTVAAYVNRRQMPTRTVDYRSPSPRRSSEEHWPRPRTRSPSTTTSKHQVLSDDVEQELEKLVIQYELRRTQKKQVWIQNFLEYKKCS